MAALKIFTAIAALFFLLLFGGMELQKRGWEKMLSGPFYGEPYSETPSAPVVTSLLINADRLNIHHPGGTNHPIAALVGADAKLIWAHTLVPVLPGKTEPRGQIQSVHLTKLRKVKDGYKVFLTCYWTGGGDEGGIIYLDKNRRFKSFALAW